MKLAIRLAVVLIVQAAAVAVAVFPQLSARATGDEYLLRVEPVDPIDPFRGAYVALGYPDLPAEDIAGEGPRYVRLAERDGVWVAAGESRTRPSDGVYLACDDRFVDLRCGIESWFLPQDEAARFEELVAGGNAVARIKIDSRGNAAVIGVEER